MYSLCCISNDLKKRGISFKKMTWSHFQKNLSKNGEADTLQELGNRWLNNVQTTSDTIRYCTQNSWGYRVSSSIFSLLTHPDFSYTIQDAPQYPEILDLFSGIRTTNQSPRQNYGRLTRLSTHPDQFNVLASLNQDAVKKTIIELNHHGWLMDMLGCERNYSNPINIHVNCSAGTHSEIAARFIKNLEKCDKSVTSRLVIENEDKGMWNVDALLLFFYSEYGIPITFDNLHDKCNPSELEDCIEKCAETWGQFKPLFHYSESHPDYIKTNPRKHADLPSQRPPGCSIEVDWEVELKSKDEAIRKLQC